jgi:hypothetical protein
VISHCDLKKPDNEMFRISRPNQSASSTTSNLVGGNRHMRQKLRGESSVLLEAQCLRQIALRADDLNVITLATRLVPPGEEYRSHDEHWHECERD